MDAAQHAALRSEIAQLSGAIDQQRSRIAHRGSMRGRGRGRHRSLVLTHTPTDQWVHRRTNRSLALVNSSVYAPDRPRAPANSGEVLVDGVPFVFDESGTKLVKRSTLPTTPPAPRQASVHGEAYVRTKRGHLISKALVIERRAARAQHERTQRLAALGQQIGRAHQQQRAMQRAKAPPQLCTYYTRTCLLYTSPSPRDQRGSRMPSSA